MDQSEEIKNNICVLITGKFKNAINGLIDVCRLPGTTKERTHSCLKASEWVSQGCGVCVLPWRMVDQKPHLTEGTGSQQACIKTSRAHSDTVRSRAYLECRILWRGWRIVRGETNNRENQSPNTASHRQSAGYCSMDNGEWPGLNRASHCFLGWIEWERN